jgi:hypothetical protein
MSILRTSQTHNVLKYKVGGEGDLSHLPLKNELKTMQFL